MGVTRPSEHALFLQSCRLLGLPLAFLLAALLPSPLVLHLLEVGQPLAVVVVVTTEMLFQLCYGVVLLTTVLQALLL